MPSTPILALNGPIGVGKTSLMDFFKRDGYNVIHTPIAGPLRREVCDALGLPSLTWLEENKNVVRPVLVAWAEFKRSQDEDYWIRKLVDVLGARDVMFGQYLTGKDIFYIDDMRYYNEFLALKALGAVTIRLDRPSEESIAYMVEKGSTQEGARFVIESRGETELPAHAAEFDLRYDGTRRRPLRSLYEDIKFDLQRLDVLKVEF